MLTLDNFLSVVDERFKDNVPFTLRSAVNFLEAEGLRSEDASVMLCEGIKDQKLGVGSDYVLFVL